MKLLMCNCHHCRNGRRVWHHKYWREKIKYLRSAARGRNRRRLKAGDYDNLEDAVNVGYTDMRL